MIEYESLIVDRTSRVYESLIADTINSVYESLIVDTINMKVTMIREKLLVKGSALRLSGFFALAWRATLFGLSV